jgi:hypothetical protein
VREPLGEDVDLNPPGMIAGCYRLWGGEYFFLMFFLGYAMRSGTYNLGALMLVTRVINDPLSAEH